jgi:hypothetical protein
MRPEPSALPSLVSREEGDREYRDDFVADSVGGDETYSERILDVPRRPLRRVAYLRWEFCRERERGS